MMYHVLYHSKRAIHRIVVIFRNIQIGIENDYAELINSMASKLDLDVGRTMEDMDNF